MANVNPSESRKDDSKSQVSESQVYDVLTSLVVHSEQIRWTRLNIFLVVTSIFLATWAGIFAGTEPFLYKKIILSILCVPGIVLGILWARLGWRSSMYMDDFHDRAYNMEKSFAEGRPKPFHTSQKNREQLPSSLERFTSSKWIVTYIPVMFAFLFFALLVLSLIAL